MRLRIDAELLLRTVKRLPVMYNDFVLIGPNSDPAGVKGMTDIGKALTTIRDKAAGFISRGDKSGTHSAELSLWKAAGVDIEKSESSELSKACTKVRMRMDAGGSLEALGVC